jgi:predicted SAM-dependent methyltransferase
MIKLNLGCGKDIKEGFVNCDIQPYKGIDFVIDCSKLKQFETSSAGIIFCHSFFEHLYIYQQMPFLLECKRVLKKEGFLVILGVPDFEKICRLYLNKARALPVFGMPFNLYQAYRLTHGDFEDGKKAYIPQLHKCIFDKEDLASLFRLCGFSDTVIFNYNFPKEEQNISIGIVAFKEGRPANLKIKNILKEFKTYFDNLEGVCVS